MEQSRDMQTLLDRIFSDQPSLTVNWLNALTSLKKECVNQKGMSQSMEAHKSHFASISNIYLSRVQRRVLVSFRTAASRPFIIKTPGTRTSTSCFEPCRQITSSGIQQSKVIKKKFVFKEYNIWNFSETMEVFIMGKVKTLLDFSHFCSLYCLFFE